MRKGAWDPEESRPLGWPARTGRPRCFQMFRVGQSPQLVTQTSDAATKGKILADSMNTFGAGLPLIDQMPSY